MWTGRFAPRRTPVVRDPHGVVRSLSQGVPQNPRDEPEPPDVEPLRRVLRFTSVIRKRIPSEESISGFMMTPMIDIVFQLIIFFMLVMDMSQVQA